MSSDVIELGGVAEISAELGVPRSTVSMWDTRETKGYPKPLARLASGPVFDMAAVRAWWAGRPRQEESA